MQIKQVNTFLFIIMSIILILSSLYSAPDVQGDGFEYSLMLESFSNHLSPELRAGDIESYFDTLGKYLDDRGAKDSMLTDSGLNENVLNRYGYFKANNGKFYSYHFWAYPLFSLPIKAILKLLSLDELKAFEITNALVFILLLAALYYSNFPEIRKTFYSLMLFLSPVVWFVHWSHPELFMAVLVALSFVFLEKKKYNAAVFCSAIASMQNQAIVLLVLYMLAKTSKQNLKTYAVCILAFIPNIFYFMFFGTYSMLSSSTSISYISLKRVLELFFDFNIGLFPYIPLLLAIFFYIIISSLKKKRITFEIEALILITGIMIVCATTYNWNHGTSGPSRYVIWMLPIIFFVISKKSKSMRLALAVALVIQFNIILLYGLTPEVNYKENSYAAELALNYFPAIYNPSFEIFYERTTGTDLYCTNPLKCTYLNPTIYYYNSRCRKALVTCEGLEALEIKCGTLKSECLEGWFYVDY